MSEHSYILVMSTSFLHLTLNIANMLLVTETFLLGPRKVGERSVFLMWHKRFENRIALFHIDDDRTIGIPTVSSLCKLSFQELQTMNKRII